LAFKFQRAADELVTNHEINVTPFIDVMLVLLVIFMVTAPLAMVHVPLELPSSSASPTPPPTEPVILSLQKNLQISIGDVPVTRTDVPAVLVRDTRGDRNTRIYVRADRSINYGDLMDVMDLLRNAGYQRVALMSRSASPTPRPAAAPAAAPTAGPAAPQAPRR
jgi:biopolymer transport protein ExbD